MSDEFPEIPGYEVIALIGRGGMADVYEGIQKTLGRRVAIKIRRARHDRHDEVLRKRFLESARLHGSIFHPCVVHVIDCVQTSVCDTVILEYLEGDTVEARLRQLKRLPVIASLKAVIGIADALSCLHAKGVVHRDIKPSNLMYVEEGLSSPLKLLDFGVAKGLGTEHDLTLKGSNIGTLWYMPPEQFGSGKVEPSWDVYALAGTLYEMISGRLPFHERTETAVFRRHIDGKPIPEWPHELMVQYGDLFHVLKICLETRRETRLCDLAVFQKLLSALVIQYEDPKSCSTQRSVAEDRLVDSLRPLPADVSERLKRILLETPHDTTITMEAQRVDGSGEYRSMDDTVITDTIVVGDEQD